MLSWAGIKLISEKQKGTKEIFSPQVVTRNTESSKSSQLEKQLECLGCKSSAKARIAS